MRKQAVQEDLVTLPVRLLALKSSQEMLKPKCWG